MRHPGATRRPAGAAKVTFSSAEGPECSPHRSKPNCPPDRKVPLSRAGWRTRCLSCPAVSSTCRRRGRQREGGSEEAAQKKEMGVDDVGDTARDNASSTKP